MGTYIKSSTGLVRLDQPITSESIKQALGYLPVNFSGNYEDLTNKPIDGGVWTHDSNNFYVVDNNENVIALIDDKGIHSIDFDINGKSVKDHIEDKDIHISAAEREKWNDPLSSTDSELYIADDSGNILALFDVNGLTITAIKTNTINGVDANDLATKTYITEQIKAINETLNNIDSILEPVEAEIDALQQTVADIKTKTDNLEAAENDASLVITDDAENAIAQFDESGLTVTAVKTNSINGTAVDEFSTKAELNTKAQELQSAITSGDNAVSNQLNTHIANKSNPHEVTAAQVGAYTTTEADNTFATKEHNHDDVYSKLDHTHDLPTVSEGTNINVTKTDLDYNVALASEIELTKVKATTVSTDILETPEVLQNGDTFAVQDTSGNTIAQIDESGLSTIAVYINGKEAATKDELFSGSYGDLTGTPKISGTVTKALGGIAKDKTYTDAALETVLSDLLFPYVELSFTSISLKDASNKTISSTLEYGKEVTVEYVVPSFTKGSKDITSIKIGTTSGGDDLYSGTTATSGTNIDLTTSKTFDGETGGTIYCTIGDGEKTWTKSSSINYKYYNYYTVTNSTTKPTTGTNNGQSTQAEITTTDNSYIWFLMPDTSKTQIQQFAMNQWNNVNTTYAGTVEEFNISTEQKVTYYAYRTDKMMSATGTYRIN